MKTPSESGFSLFCNMMLPKSFRDFFDFARLVPLESLRTNEDVGAGETCFLLESPDGDVITSAPPTRQVALDRRTQCVAVTWNQLRLSG